MKFWQIYNYYWKCWRFISACFRRRKWSIILFCPAVVIFVLLIRHNCPSPSSRIQSVPNLVNVTQFKFLQNNEHICNSNVTCHQSHLLLVIVLSARHQFRYRQRIRETWGSIRHYKNWTLRKVFILGSHDNSSQLVNQQSLIDEESRQFNDIIIADFIDSYRNLSVKHLVGYNWVLNYCSRARYVLRVDDDVFVNPFRVVNFLNAKTASNSSGDEGQSLSNNFICKVAWHASPIRESDKWKVSLEEFSGNVYPPYCSDSAFLVTPRIISQILTIHSQVQLFWIEDVFITGLLRNEYNSFVNANKSKRVQFSSTSSSTGHLEQDIGFEDIANLCQPYDLTIRWNPHKLFYLLKGKEGEINFRALEIYWSLTVMHRMDEENNARLITRQVRAV